VVFSELAVNPVHGWVNGVFFQKGDDGVLVLERFGHGASLSSPQLENNNDYRYHLFQHKFLFQQMPVHFACEQS
jgi:hypothetical protein